MLTLLLLKLGIMYTVQSCLRLLNFREKDINEVVQTTTVFASVSKGVLAKREDLQSVFGTDDDDVICRIILSDGDMQVHIQIIDE